MLIAVRTIWIQYVYRYVCAYAGILASRFKGLGFKGTVYMIHYYTVYITWNNNAWWNITKMHLSAPYMQAILNSVLIGVVTKISA